MKWTALLCLMGCGPLAQGAPAVEFAPQAIMGGGLADTDTGVVFVRRMGTTRRCSGSVIGRNLVLTARHCVSNFQSQDVDGVVCGNTSFDGVEPAANVDVALGANAEQPTASVAVREVWVMPGDGGYCDHDAALLLLARPLAQEEAQVLEPRVGSPARKGEEYSALGFGASVDTGEGFGLRRRRDGLFIACVGTHCGVPDVGAREWQGTHAICRGDSGGPALDVDGRIIGVASRSAARCEDPIYVNVAEVGAWLRQAGIKAADLLGEAAPAWTRLPTLHAVEPTVLRQGCAASGGTLASVILFVGCLRRLRKSSRG